MIMGGASWFPRLRRFLRPAGGAKADRRCTVAGGAHRRPRGSWWRLLVDEEREKKITFKVWRANGSDRDGIGGRGRGRAHNAHIDVGAGESRLHINGKEEKFDFRPKKEQCLMIRVKFGPNP